MYLAFVWDGPGEDGGGFRADGGAVVGENSLFQLWFIVIGVTWQLYIRHWKIASSAAHFRVQGQEYGVAELVVLMVNSWKHNKAIDRPKCVLYESSKDNLCWV